MVDSILLHHINCLDCFSLYPIGSEAASFLSGKERPLQSSNFVLYWDHMILFEPVFEEQHNGFLKFRFFMRVSAGRHLPVLHHSQYRISKHAAFSCLAVLLRLGRAAKCSAPAGLHSGELSARALDQRASQSGQKRMQGRADRRGLSQCFGPVCL